jgi:hypothetical protein
MKCPNCGAEIDDDSVFCTECGKKIEKIEEKREAKEQPPKEEVKAKPVKEAATPERSSQSNKLVLILAIVIPVVLIGTTFGVLGGLGVFSKDEAAPETITEEQYTEQAEEYTVNAHSTGETYESEVQEATEEVTDEYILKPDDLSFKEKNISRAREHLDDEEILNFPSISFMYPDDWYDLFCGPFTLDHLSDYMIADYMIEYYTPGHELFEWIEIWDWKTNEHYKSLIEEGISKGDLALKILLDLWNLNNIEEFIESAENEGAEEVEIQNYGENGVFMSSYIEDMGVIKSYYDVIEQENVFVFHFVQYTEDYYDKWGKYLVYSARNERLFIEE